VVQAADFWNFHDRARRGELDRPEVGCVLVEREMGARSMGIGEVTGQNARQVSFVEDKNVVETLAAYRADQALGERICQGLCGAEPAADLAARFGIAVRSPAFWRASLDVVREQIAEFERLTTP